MLNPGDLIFVGWDGDNEDVAFVTTAAIAGGEVIYFTDSEWNGTSFLPGEQLIEWIVPPEGIPAGQVLTLDMTPGGGAVVTDTAELTGDVSGSIDYIQGGGQLASNNEMVWAFQGTRVGDDVTPENFVAVIGNEADGGDRATPNLDNTGLTQENGAIIIDGDHDYMVFDGFDALPDPVSAPGAMAAISNTSNWTVAGPGRNFDNDNPNAGGGFNISSPRLFDPTNVTTLYFSGANVAFFDDISSDDGDVSANITVSQQPFLPTDVVEIDILNSSIRADGEFDFDEVIFVSIRVRRGDDVYEFQVDDGSKIKESGASNSDPGQSIEQGDTFFTTNDDVSTPAGISPFPPISGTMVFALDATFAEAAVTNIVREQEIEDENGDPVGTENANFFVGTSLDPDPPIPCFVAGTRIMTDMGPVPIEELHPGDRIVTRDHGLVPLRWVGGREVPAQGAYAPIRFTAGSLDNDRDLLVSPQHKMLLTGWKAELYFGEPEVLIAAKYLCDDNSVRRDTSMRTVHYLHLLFDRHEVIYAEGCASESLDPAYLAEWPEDDQTSIEIATLFPELFATHYPHHKTARASLKHYEGALFSTL
ncbi:Hint domain-containing protein [Tropicibacter sp. R16_0]|uniref:Hint domain-containing protein n=1 Tax=Tropicibacter sp. R16_0 TaxID=2821102 RepID=UPI001AD9FA2A|nr:Hint domain-containing protein [Tropicibacter sp. R16_0]MBO9453205.1 Hint domain-containing protein [Tropicibacter sp. R16_0]